MRRDTFVHVTLNTTLIDFIGNLTSVLSTSKNEPLLKVFYKICSLKEVCYCFFESSLCTCMHIISNCLIERIKRNKLYLEVHSEWRGISVQY